MNVNKLEIQQNLGIFCNTKVKTPLCTIKKKLNTRDIERVHKDIHKNVVIIEPISKQTLIKGSGQAEVSFHMKLCTQSLHLSMNPPCQLVLFFM